MASTLAEFEPHRRSWRRLPLALLAIALLLAGSQSSGEPATALSSPLPLHCWVEGAGWRNLFPGDSPVARFLPAPPQDPESAAAWIDRLRGRIPISGNGQLLIPPGGGTWLYGCEDGFRRRIFPGNRYLVIGGALIPQATPVHGETSSHGSRQTIPLPPVVVANEGTRVRFARSPVTTLVWVVEGRVRIVGPPGIEGGDRPLNVVVEAGHGWMLQHEEARSGQEGAWITTLLTQDVAAQYETMVSMQTERGWEHGALLSPEDASLMPIQAALDRGALLEARALVDRISSPHLRAEALYLVSLRALADGDQELSREAATTLRSSHSRSAWAQAPGLPIEASDASH